MCVKKSSSLSLRAMPGASADGRAGTVARPALGIGIGIGREMAGPRLACCCPDLSYCLFCQGHLPDISTSRVKLRNVRISTTMARTPIDSNVNSIATV